MIRTVLFVGAGIEAIPAIERAKQLGLHVVVSDANPRAPGLAHADDCLLASTYDVQATVQAASDFSRTRRRIDGVMCVATDVPLTVAAVAEHLKLPGIRTESARLAMDKLAMKDKFAVDGVPIPPYRALATVSELEQVVYEWGYPLVIKPVDSRGARGVLRLTGDTNLAWAFERAREESVTRRVMIEKFLHGPQVSTESIVIDGVAHTPGFSDRNYEYMERFAPYIIENGGDLPSNLPSATQELIKSVVQDAAESLGIRNGVVKGDIVVCDDKVFVIEIAARLSGGYFCSHEIPLNTGVDFVGAAIRLALGERIEPTELIPQFQNNVCQRYWFAEEGTVTRISGATEANALPGIALLELRVKPGDQVGPVHAHPARAGVVICTGATRQQARDRATTVIDTVRIDCQRALAYA